MSKKKKKGPVEIGDVFNETDDEQEFKVVYIDAKRDPPIAFCQRMEDGHEAEETETEYSLQYVKECVRLRRNFVYCDYPKLNVYSIYKMSKSGLITALNMAK